MHFLFHKKAFLPARAMVRNNSYIIVWRSFQTEQQMIHLES